MSKAILPPEWAKLTAEHAGEKYRPSNGTEGEFFFSTWCRQCERDKSMREGCDIDECDDNERCDIIANTLCFDVDHEKYPKEWQYGNDGQPCCTSFVPIGNSIPERCIYTLDMFEGTSI